MITQKELLENLVYNKDTGVFTRKISLNTKIRVGDAAREGCADEIRARGDAK
jgi:hypothetical protein